MGAAEQDGLPWLTLTGQELPERPVGRDPAQIREMPPHPRAPSPSAARAGGSRGPERGRIEGLGISGGALDEVSLRA